MSPAAGKPVTPQFQIDNEVTRCIRKHARAHMKTEVCGVLIGETSNGVVEITASIEALNAAQAGTHVTFTQDAWRRSTKSKTSLIQTSASLVGTILTPASASFYRSTTLLSIETSSHLPTRWLGSTTRIPTRKAASGGSMARSIEYPIYPSSTITAMVLSERLRRLTSRRRKTRRAEPSIGSEPSEVCEASGNKVGGVGSPLRWHAFLPCFSDFLSLISCFLE